MSHNQQHLTKVKCLRRHNHAHQEQASACEIRYQKRKASQLLIKESKQKTVKESQLTASERRISDGACPFHLQKNKDRIRAPRITDPGISPGLPSGRAQTRGKTH